ADDAVQVDVRDRGAGALREALGLPQQVTALVDEGLPVPGEVRGGLPLARGRVDVGDLRAGGGGAGHELAVVGPTDGDRGAGEVRDHGGAGERGLGRRGDRHPHVLADLDEQAEPRQVGHGDQLVRGELVLGPADAYRGPADV